MRNIGVGIVLCAALLCGGCAKETKPDSGQPTVKVQLTPEQIAKICHGAGQVSALSWVAIAQPTQDDVNAVKFVIGEIDRAMVNYQGQGFLGMLPQIDEAIKKAIPGTDKRSVALRRLAHLLASTGLVSLDNLFFSHPDWSQKGDQAAGYVRAFGEGALEELGNVKARVATP